MPHEEKISLLLTPSSRPAKENQLWPTFCSLHPSVKKIMYKIILCCRKESSSPGMTLGLCGKVEKEVNTLARGLFLTHRIPGNEADFSTSAFRLTYNRPTSFESSNQMHQHERGTMNPWIVDLEFLYLEWTHYRCLRKWHSFSPKCICFLDHAYFRKIYQVLIALTWAWKWL